MKFSTHLETHWHPAWQLKYIRYGFLKGLIQAAVKDGYDARPRSVSLTSSQVSSNRHDDFFMALEADVKMINNFTTELSSSLRTRLTALAAAIKQAGLESEEQVHDFMQRARQLGDEYIMLERYVDLNYAGLKKLLKKHDKLLPAAKARGFYAAHVDTQPWVRGDHHDLQVTLTKVFSGLHRAAEHVHSSSTQECSTSSCSSGTQFSQTFWVKRENLPVVMNVLLQHLPARATARGDSPTQDVHTLYLDNGSLELYHNLLYNRPYACNMALRWTGRGKPATVEVLRKYHSEGWRFRDFEVDSFPLQTSKVCQFLLGRWSWHDAGRQVLAAMPAVQPAPGTSTESNKIAHEYALFRAFTEAQRTAETKRLQPMIEVSMQETVFASPNDNSLSVIVDQGILMSLQFTTQGREMLEGGTWRQDPAADTITLPYSLVRVSASLDPAQGMPRWLYKLLMSDALIEVNDFSFYVHGCAGLMPDMVRAVPYWIDDGPIQESLYAGPSTDANELIEPGAASHSLADASHHSEPSVSGSHHRSNSDSGDADVSSSSRRSTLDHSSTMPPARPTRHRMWGTVEVRKENGVLVAKTLGLRGSGGSVPKQLHMLPATHEAMSASTSNISMISHSESMPVRRTSITMDSHSISAPLGPFPAVAAVTPSVSGSVPLLHALSRHVGVGGWQAKLLQRLSTRGQVYTPPITKEPELALRNEQVFMVFMRQVIMLGGMATMMLGFAASASVDLDASTAIHISEVTALTLLASSIVLCAFNLILFMKRSLRKPEKTEGLYEGEMSVSFILFVSISFMSFLFVFNIVDLIDISRLDPDP